MRLFNQAGLRAGRDAGACSAHGFGPVTFAAIFASGATLAAAVAGVATLPAGMEGKAAEASGRGAEAAFEGAAASPGRLALAARRFRWVLDLLLDQSVRCCS